MKVLNLKNSRKMEFVPYENITIENFERIFGKTLPVPPYKDPIIDYLCLYLYENKTLLVKLVHHKRHYECFDPVFIDDKIITPTCWLYYQEFRQFFEGLEQTKDWTDKEFQQWRTLVGIAISKLTGNFYSSAGKD